VFNERAGYLSVPYSRLHIGSAQRFPEARRLTTKDIDGRRIPPLLKLTMPS
jgi:hypothetical protein